MSRILKNPVSLDLLRMVQVVSFNKLSTKAEIKMEIFVIYKHV